MKKMPNKITGANAGEPRQLTMWTRWAARVAQFWRKAMFSSRDPELKRRIETAAKTQRRLYAAFQVLHDPIEDDEAASKAIKAAQAKADAEIDSRRERGRCHGVWSRMKVILKEEHGVIWYSPSEMNPGMKFD
jgi:hypothetical protein